MLKLSKDISARLEKMQFYCFQGVIQKHNFEFNIPLVEIKKYVKEIVKNIKAEHD